MSVEIATVGGYVLSPLSVGYLAAALAMLGLGLHTLLSDEPLQESLFFFLFTLAVALWLLGFGCMIGAPDRGRALQWLHLAYVGVPVIPAVLYTVAVQTLGVADRRRWVLALLWVGAMGFLVAVVGTEIVVEGLYRYPWGFYPDYSPAGLGFIGFVVGGIGMSLGEYARRYRIADREEERARARRYLLAFGVGSLAVVDFIPCYGLDMYPVAYAVVLPMAGMIGHTIRKWHLTRLTPAFAADRILDTMSDPVFVCDLEGRIRVTNPAASEVLGRGQEELVGAAFEGLLHSDDRNERGDLGLLERESVRDEEVTLEARSGERVRVSLSSSGVRNAGGRRVGTAVLVRDIRRRKALQRQLQQTQKMEAVGRLAGGVAHDFNNLLQVILANATLISAQITDDGEMKETMAQIRQACDQARGIIDGLLTFSRKSSGEPRVLDLNEVVADTEGILRRLLVDGVGLELGLAGGPVRTRMDRNHMQQVIVNLVVNAQDAMPQGGTVLLRTGRMSPETGGDPSAPGANVGAEVFLAVADTGHGMDRETAEQIFEPFFTTKEEGDGTGLGLSIVHGIVTEAGGRIDVESEPSEGTTFTVRLPEVEDGG